MEGKTIIFLLVVGLLAFWFMKPDMFNTYKDKALDAGSSAFDKVSGKASFTEMKFSCLTSENCNTAIPSCVNNCSCSDEGRCYLTK